MVLKHAEPGYSQIPLDAGPSPKNTFAVPKSENWLVVWNISFIFSHHIGNVIIPTDSYFSEG